MAKSTPEELSKLTEDQQQSDDEFMARLNHRARVVLRKYGLVGNPPTERWLKAEGQPFKSNRCQAS